MSITKKEVKFNELEREIYKYCFSIGCEMIKTMLETYDEDLSKSRNKAEYRHKGKRKTVIKTMMGEVEFYRAVYEIRDSEGRKTFVYLLDEAMGRSSSGYYSGMLSEQIAAASCEGSYRNAARTVSEMTGQTLSHTAAWKVVQGIGERIDEKEQQMAAIAAKNQGNGKLESKTLFEEQDGIYLKLQGKSRKQHGAGYEMKVAIAYDGAKKTGKNRYELTNKVACANFETTGKFQKRKEGVIAGTYNVDEIEIRLLNGDGANWIKNSIMDENTHFQLDPFHRNKAIRQWVKNPDMQKQIFKLLYEKRIDELLEYIEALTNSVDEKEERENLLELLTYFTNNKEGLVPCHRRKLNIPPPPNGVDHRRMGTMESNIFTIIGNRMKDRRANWSINGGNNLARLLCLKHTKKLPETLSSLTTVILPEKYAEEITINFSAHDIVNSVGKGYNGYHQAIAPAVPAYKWLRDLGAIKALSF